MPHSELQGMLFQAIIINNVSVKRICQYSQKINKKILTKVNKISLLLFLMDVYITNSYYFFNNSQSKIYYYFNSSLVQ